MTIIKSARLVVSIAPTPEITDKVINKLFPANWTREWGNRNTGKPESITDEEMMKAELKLRNKLSQAQIEFQQK